MMHAVPSRRSASANPFAPRHRGANGTLARRTRTCRSWFDAAPRTVMLVRAGMLALLVLCVSTARADAVLEYDGGDAACHGDFARLAISGLTMRVDSAPPAQDTSFIYDAAEKTGIALDHKRKQRFELEFDDDAIDFQGDVMKSSSNMVDRKVEKMQAQACGRDGAHCPPGGVMNPFDPATMPQVDPKQIESLMQQNMGHMTAEQRARMQQSIEALRQSGYGGLAGPAAAPVVEATGETRDVNGVACAVERVTLQGRVQREDCRAPLEALGLDAADLKRLQRAFQRMQKFTSAIRDNARFLHNMPREQADAGHVLVARRCFADGQRGAEVSLRVRNGAAPADWFVPPADYARAQMAGGRDDGG